MSEETIFSKIIRKEIPADIVYEDEYCLAFKDISPQAPVHILLIPKEQLDRLSNANADHKKVLGHMLTKVSEIAKAAGVKENGYRLIINDGNDGGQTVYHLHMHIMGGRQMTWPPG